MMLAVECSYRVSCGIGRPTSGPRQGDFNSPAGTRSRSHGPAEETREALLWGRRLSVHSGFLQWWYPDPSSNALTLFDFNGHDIRVINSDGQPWSVAAEICYALAMHTNSRGKPNVTVAMRNLSEDEIGVYPIQTKARGADERKLCQIQKGVRAQVIINATNTIAPDEHRTYQKANAPDALASAFVGRTPRLALVSESGLYKLVLRSDKPNAKEFQTG